MLSRIVRPLLFGAYQLSIMVGIALLPVAMLVGKLGVTLPIHRVVRRIGSAYERAGDAA